MKQIHIYLHNGVSVPAPYRLTQDDWDKWNKEHPDHGKGPAHPHPFVSALHKDHPSGPKIKAHLESVPHHKLHTALAALHKHGHTGHESSSVKKHIETELDRRANRGTTRGVAEDAATFDDWAKWNEEHKGKHHTTYGEAHKALAARHQELEKAGFKHHKSVGEAHETDGHTNHLKHANGSTATVYHKVHASGAGHHVVAHVKEVVPKPALKPAPKTPGEKKPVAKVAHGKAGHGAKHIFVSVKKGVHKVEKEVDKHERDAGKK